MQLRHLKTIHAPQEGIAKVTGITWSSNNRRLAVVTTDRVVHLCDENGERRDKFSTKPADPKGSKTYVVRGMAWSPDSSKLAIAQSDNIVFVYKLGHEWGDKKSICNKFQQASSITCICWPESRPNELVFGLAEGKMKVRCHRRRRVAAGAHHATPRSMSTLPLTPHGLAPLARVCRWASCGRTSRRHSTRRTHSSSRAAPTPRAAPSSPPTSTAASIDSISMTPPAGLPTGSYAATRTRTGAFQPATGAHGGYNPPQRARRLPRPAHTGGRTLASAATAAHPRPITTAHGVSRPTLPPPSTILRARCPPSGHRCVPYALSWGECICAAGSDQLICFYDKEGTQLQRFDYSHDEAEKEFTVAAFNPSGETVIVGSFNRFRTFTLNQLDGSWQDAGVKQVDNLYTVTALAWKCDGSRLTVGSLCGAVDLYDACIRRVRYKGRFEFTYVSTSTVIVKRLSSGARIVLKSHFGYEVRLLLPLASPRSRVLTAARNSSGSARRKQRLIAPAPARAAAALAAPCPPLAHPNLASLAPAPSPPPPLHR